MLEHVVGTALLCLAAFNDLTIFIFSGTELQICPRGLTCCTEEMEKKLWIVSKDKYGEALQSSASAMQRLFSQRSNKFNGKIWCNETNYILKFNIISKLYHEKLNIYLLTSYQKG